MNRGGDKQMGLRICATQGFLTDPWYSRGFWMYARRWPGYRRRFEAAPKTGTLLCFNDKTVCVLKAFPIGGHSPTFYPARQGYLLFADDVNTEPQLWGEEGSSPPVDWLTGDAKGRTVRRNRAIPIARDQAVVTCLTHAENHPSGLPGSLSASTAWSSRPTRC